MKDSLREHTKEFWCDVKRDERILVGLILFVVCLLFLVIIG